MAKIITIEIIENQWKLFRNESQIGCTILLYTMYGKGIKDLDLMSKNGNDD